MLKIRRSMIDRLIFNMGIRIPGKDGLCIETRPRLLKSESRHDANFGITGGTGSRSVPPVMTKVGIIMIPDFQCGYITEVN